jgi:hypothetical protein
LIDDDPCATPFVGGGRRTVGVCNLRTGALEKKLRDGGVARQRSKFPLLCCDRVLQFGLLCSLKRSGVERAIVADSFEILIESSGVELPRVQFLGKLEG